MDITRLPATPYLRAADTTNRTAPEAPVTEAAGPEVSPRVSQRREEVHTRVVQGELLYRDQPSAQSQSTRSFIDERNLEHAGYGKRRSNGGHQSQAAIGRYLNNTRAESPGDLAQGRSVNYFV